MAISHIDKNGLTVFVDARINVPIIGPNSLTTGNLHRLSGIVHVNIPQLDKLNQLEAHWNLSRRQPHV